MRPKSTTPCRSFKKSPGKPLRSVPHGGGAKDRCAPRLRVGVVAVVASTLSALVVGVSPERVLATPVASAVYVSNYETSNVTGYPTTANGNVAPTVTLGGASPSTPWGSVLDSAGDLWVANYGNNTVAEYTPAELAAGGSPIPAVTISGVGVLDEPTAVAFDSTGDLWVANYGSSTVLEYTPAELAAGGSPTPAVTISATANSVDVPWGLGFDAAGDLWVANEGNDTLAEYTPAELTASGSPTPAVTISATANSLEDPATMAFDSSGDLWVANYSADTVVEYTPAQLAASGSPTPAVTISEVNNSLDGPGAVAFDKAGDLWVPNYNSSTLVEYAPGQLTASGSPTPAVTISEVNNSLDGPFGALDFDSAGNLWVPNYTSSTLVEYSASQLASSGSPLPTATLSVAPGVYYSYALAFDRSGDLWVLNYGNNSVVEFSSSELSTGSPAANVVLTSTATDLDDPLGLGFDPSGDLWVANYEGNTLVEYTPSQFATSGSPTPAVTLSSSSGSLDGPWALAFDASGNLWVSNYASNTLSEYTPSQLASSGSPTPAVTLSASGSSLDSPDGLAFDASGDLWVANASGNTVVEYSLSQLASSGSPTPAVTLSSTAASSLDNPVGLAFDPSGNLWVSNDYSDSLSEFASSQLATGSPTPMATVAGALTGIDGPGGIAIEAAPAAPGGVSAVPGDSQVTLSWGTVTGAGSYQVFDSTSPGGEDYSGTAACTTSTNSCTVSGLTDGTEYYFTVEALNSGGASAPSAEVSAKPQSAAPATTTTTTSAATTTTTVPPVVPVPVVTTIATATALRSSANPAAVGADVTFTASVSPLPGGGTLRFADNGSTPPGCGAVPVSTTTGQGTCSVTYNSAGTHMVAASFSGYGSYSTSSASLNQVVAAPSFPDAGASFPDGALVRFGASAYVLAGGRAFATSAHTLVALQKVDRAQVVAAPEGTVAPTAVAPRPGTLLSTRAVNGAPAVYVAGSGGELYGFAGPGQFAAGGFDPDLVVAVPGLGGLKVSAESAGAAGLTAFSTVADGALVHSGGAYYVFAGGRAFGVPSPAVLAKLRAADPARVLRASVGAAQASAPVASGVLLAAGGQGVFVTYHGDAYRFKTTAQQDRDGYGGTAPVPVPGPGHLTVISSYSGS